MRVGIHCITGATGLIGSHVAEQLIERGERVRALVRANSDPTFLRQIGAEVVLGDLEDPASLRPFVRGAATVIHCAARVSDWGNWPVFERSIVATTRHLLQACMAEGRPAFLHVSSVAVYGHPTFTPGQLLDEDAPLGQRLWLWDYYIRAKIQAEELVQQYGGHWTILRPSWTYGPRDRNSFPRVLRLVRSGWGLLIGRGDNLLNIVHARDVALGVVLAASTEQANHRIYNLCSDGQITQRDFLNALTDGLGQPRVRWHLPYRLAFYAGFLGELLGRSLGWKSPPSLTRYGVALVGRSTLYSTKRAREELGWVPRVHPLQGLCELLAALPKS